MEYYDLNVKDKHDKINEVVEKQFNILKKYVGREIFSTFEIFCKDDETGEINYSVPKKIHKNIFTDEILINLKFRLALSGFNAINEIINNEYGKILTLQHENDDLKRELKFYKSLANNK